MAQTQKLQKVTEELAEMTSKLASFQEQSAKEKAELTEQIAIYEWRLKSEGEARAQDMESEMKKFEMARESAEVIKVELTSAIADRKNIWRNCDRKHHEAPSSIGKVGNFFAREIARQDRRVWVQIGETSDNFGRGRSILEKSRARNASG